MAAGVRAAFVSRPTRKGAPTISIISLIGLAAGAGIICVAIRIILGIRRKAFSLRPAHLRIVAGDVRNFFRFKVGDHRSSLAELHDLLDLPAGALPSTRGRAASPDFLLILAKHILTHRPKWVLECGPGVSTIVIAAALKKAGTGQAYCLEHLEGYGQKVQKRVDELGYGRWARVIIAPLIRHRIGERDWDWYDVADLPEEHWDMIIIDGPPASVGPAARYPAGPLLIPRLSAAGHIFVDDTDRAHDREICDRFVSEFHMKAAHLSAEKGCCRLAFTGAEAADLGTQRRGAAS